ncbi:hypothetical protein TNCV_1126661 [Trichonephila clavipes]|nr:hypothetical protein TNCV_1126661 [Trichonephila clavipes]
MKGLPLFGASSVCQCQFSSDDACETGAADLPCQGLVAGVSWVRVLVPLETRCVNRLTPLNLSRLKRLWMYPRGSAVYMRLPHIAKVDLVKQRMVYPGSVVEQAWTIRFRLEIDRENKQVKETIQSDV